MNASTHHSIEITPRIYAFRLGRDYTVRFPFHMEAVKSFRSWAGAYYYPPLKEWGMEGHLGDRLERALREVETILRAHGVDVDSPPRPPVRIPVLLDRNYQPGDVIKDRHGIAHRIDSLGTPFKASRSILQFGIKGLTGKNVRYARCQPVPAKDLIDPNESFIGTRVEASAGEPPANNPAQADEIAAMAPGSTRSSDIGEIDFDAPVPEI